jgi:transcription initiation factor IIE alpha subunit
MRFRCLICEKDITPDDSREHGDDTTATLPNLEGGTISIDFGYGSRFDDMNGFVHGQEVEHQAYICDDCYEKKMHLTRAVETRTQSRFVVLSPGYRDRR